MTGAQRYRLATGGAGIVILAAFTAFRTGDVQHPEPSLADRPGSPPPSGAIRAEGRVAAYPGATVDVRSETGGLIARLSVQEQEQVRRDDVIAEIAAEEERAALAEARARVAAADADTAWFASELRRAAPLVETGSVSRQTVDRLAHELTAAQARRAVAEATVRRLGAIVSKKHIRAPIDGTVIVRSAEPGEVIAPGTRLVTLVDLRRRRVEAEVDEYDAGNIRLDMPVTITAEGYGTQNWQGTVEAIPDMVVPRQLDPRDPGRLSDRRILLVKVTLPPNVPLKLGQRVELTFQSP